jgi:hypothetical protein
MNFYFNIRTLLTFFFSFFLLGTDLYTPFWVILRGKEIFLFLFYTRTFTNVLLYFFFVDTESNLDLNSISIFSGPVT